MLRCSAEGREYIRHIMSECRSSSFLPHHHPSPATFSHSFSPPVVSAVIDMPPAINQRSSRAEQRPLSQRTGLAALEKRVREEEFIQLNLQESPTTHRYTSLWIFLTMYESTPPPHLVPRFLPLLSQINKIKQVKPLFSKVSPLCFVFYLPFNSSF